MAKAISLTCETETPAAAADRSLARTASIAAPSRLRRTTATPPAASSRTMRHRMPKHELRIAVTGAHAQVKPEDPRVGDRGACVAAVEVAGC